MINKNDILILDNLLKETNNININLNKISRAEVENIENSILAILKTKNKTIKKLETKLGKIIGKGIFFPMDLIKHMPRCQDYDLKAFKGTIDSYNELFKILDILDLSFNFKDSNIKEFYILLENLNKEYTLSKKNHKEIFSEKLNEFINKTNIDVLPELKNDFDKMFYNNLIASLTKQTILGEDYFYGFLTGVNSIVNSLFIFQMEENLK